MNDLFTTIEQSDFGARILRSEDAARASYQHLKSMALRPNLLYSYLKDTLEGSRRGLTLDELSLVCSYVQIRSEPTIHEISSLGTLFAKAQHLNELADVLANLNDEINQKHSHVKNLRDSLYAFASAFNFPVLGAFSYMQTMLYLKARAELNDPNLTPDKDSLELLKCAYPNHPFFRRRIPLLGSTFISSFFNYASFSAQFLDLLPPDVHTYSDVIRKACLHDLEGEDDVQKIASAALRLALREASSAGNDGVVGIFDFVTQNYKGHFSRHDYKKISSWANAHIGEHGVECQHERDAVRIALQYLRVLNSDQLLQVFDREATLVANRLNLAQSFCNRMQELRNSTDANVIHAAPPGVTLRQRLLSLFPALNLTSPN